MKKKKESKTIQGLYVFQRRLGTLIRQPIFIFITLWGHAAIFLGTFGLYYFEKGTNPRIHSHFDAFYWAIATVTTVGDSDGAPITRGGKIVGIVMMILGSLFLWSYTALFVGGLVAPEMKQVEKDVKELEADLEIVGEKIRVDEKTAQKLLKEVLEMHAELQKRRSDEDRRI